MKTLSLPFLAKHGVLISVPLKKENIIPFKDHTQFAVLIDILSRKYCHHAIVQTDFPVYLHATFIEAFLLYLTHEQTPRYLYAADCFYLQLDTLFLNKEVIPLLQTDIQTILSWLDNQKTYLLLGLSSIQGFTAQSHINQHREEIFLQQQLQSLLRHPQCRSIIFTPTQLSTAVNPMWHLFLQQCTSISLKALTEAEIIILLKKERVALEQFHQVIISDELILFAYLLSERYLSAGDTLEKTLRLLDSSAARANTLAVSEHSGGLHIASAASFSKPILTHAHLLQVLSGWTHIPASHLQLNHFKPHEFRQGMEQKMYGQDAVIHLLSQALQQSQAHLREHTGPLCSLLFVGPPHVGKKTAAFVFVEQLFKQAKILFFAQPAAPTVCSILDIKLQDGFDKHPQRLREVIQQMPYAVIMFEHIEQAPPYLLEQLQEMISTGQLRDENGHAYYFKQSVIILSTTVAHERLITIAKKYQTEENHQHLDMIQLIMNEQKSALNTEHVYSPQEIVADILPEMMRILPPHLCRYLHIVPFLPLQKSAIENIFRAKLKILGKQLDARYGIELGYAPETLRYLANEVLKTDINKTLEQLYFCIEQAILSQVDNQHRPTQLFLQLNETGDILRCEWLAVTTMRQHTA